MRPFDGEPPRHEVATSAHRFTVPEELDVDAVVAIVANLAAKGHVVADKLKEQLLRIHSQALRSWIARRTKTRQAPQSRRNLDVHPGPTRSTRADPRQTSAIDFYSRARCSHSRGNTCSSPSGRPAQSSASDASCPRRCTPLGTRMADDPRCAPQVVSSR